MRQPNTETQLHTGVLVSVAHQQWRIQGLAIVKRVRVDGQLWILTVGRDRMVHAWPHGAVTPITHQPAEPFRKRRGEDVIPALVRYLQAHYGARPEPPS